MEGRTGNDTVERRIDNSEIQGFFDSTSCKSTQQIDTVMCACESSKSAKRKRLEPSNDSFSTAASCPIKEILFWHNAIKRELSEIADEARKIQRYGDFTNLSAFNERLQFIAEICIYHRYFILILL